MSAGSHRLRLGCCIWGTPARSGLRHNALGRQVGCCGFAMRISTRSARALSSRKPCGRTCAGWESRGTLRCGRASACICTATPWSSLCAAGLSMRASAAVRTCSRPSRLRMKMTMNRFIAAAAGRLWEMRRPSYERRRTTDFVCRMERWLALLMDKLGRRASGLDVEIARISAILLCGEEMDCQVISLPVLSTTQQWPSRKSSVVAICCDRPLGRFFCSVRSGFLHRDTFIAS